MTIDKNYIEKLAKEFTSESIRDQDPAGLCFPTSLLLQIFLGTKKIKTTLIKGEVPKLEPDGTTKKTSHYWLQIDSTDIIVDATIQQFKNPKPIYVGTLQDNKITKTYTPTNLDFQLWFPTDFANWKYNYEQSEYPPPLDKSPFEKRHTIYILKLATLLHSELKKLTSVDEFTEQHYGLYLGPIYCYLYHWQKGIVEFQINKENMPAEFDTLLENVLQWGDTEVKKQHGTA